MLVVLPGCGGSKKLVHFYDASSALNTTYHAALLHARYFTCLYHYITSNIFWSRAEVRYSAWYNTHIHISPLQCHHGVHLLPSTKHVAHGRGGQWRAALAAGSEFLAILCALLLGAFRVAHHTLHNVGAAPGAVAHVGAVKHLSRGARVA